MREIVYLFVMESTGIGLLGGLIGVVLGALEVWYMVRHGIDFAALVQLDMTSFAYRLSAGFTEVESQRFHHCICLCSCCIVPVKYPAWLLGG